MKSWLHIHMHTSWGSSTIQKNIFTENFHMYASADIQERNTNVCCYIISILYPGFKGLQSDLFLKQTYMHAFEQNTHSLSHKRAIWVLSGR